MSVLGTSLTLPLGARPKSIWLPEGSPLINSTTTHIQTLPVQSSDSSWYDKPVPPVNC